MVETEQVQCPYCGEWIDLVIDLSVEHQQYIEDCEVCCRPITLEVTVPMDGCPLVIASHENE